MAKAEGDHITIEFEHVANEFKSIMSSKNLNLSPRCSIFKAPHILTRHNPKAYKPNAFSIGPYHYGEEGLKATQKIKLKYLQELIDRLQGTTSVRTLIDDIGKLEQEARECYAEPFDDRISNDEFVKILVLDGCFLIELFRKKAYKDLRKDDDPIFTMSYWSQCLSHDLNLVGNQIPWLVLERLFGITENTENPQCFPLSILALNFCYCFGLSKRPMGYIVALFKPFLNGTDKSKHILDLLRNAMVLPPRKTSDERSLKCQGTTLPTKLKEAGNKIKNMGLKYLSQNLNCLEQCLPKCASPREVKSEEGENEKEESNEWLHMPSATRLREAGVNLKEGTTKSLLEIKFEDGGDLVIPKLIVEDTTESLFRNLICLEQYLPDYDPIVTCYAKLLDDLIDTEKDVEILRESKILDNWLNNDDAAKFFNKLCNDTYIKKFYYLGVIKDVDKFCQRCWPRNRAGLKHNYFNNPWASISVIAAVVLLGLAILQTVFTIIK